MKYRPPASYESSENYEILTDLVRILFLDLMLILLRKLPLKGYLQHQEFQRFATLKHEPNLLSSLQKVICGLNLSLLNRSHDQVIFNIYYLRSSEAGIGTLNQRIRIEVFSKESFYFLS